MVRGKEEEMPRRKCHGGRLRGSKMCVLNEQQPGKGDSEETSSLRKLAEIEEEGSEGGGSFLRS